ncbi:hypothetical protein GGI15_000234 [Coemansia interrupta]|uniref:U2A'/phosphoprotein 32 family A C-terminal domain-containing protein n=1 Tax=Coemansia interrupta TaxID=1126814 RepID=A0A9W8LQ19_9FUNG|nr:hypothetical protein GGI15_000234 [Coemansia interrupta]
MKFTAEALAEAVGKPLSEAASIDLRNKELTHIEGLSECRSLRRLDLSNNRIGSSESFDGLQNARSLVHVNLANNELDDMSIVKQVPQLNVLNMSGNKLKAISAAVTNCSKLKALILGQNKISRIEHLDKLGDLNTLVVSHNEIKKLPDMPLLKELTKISAAHNKITTIPDLTLYPKLKEVRLNDNAIRTVPEGIRRCTSLRVIDLGNNMIDDWSSIAPLVSIPYLHNLNLKGNPICKEDGYREKVVQMLPSLRVLDGERFDQWFLDRKEKRKNRAMELAAADTSDNNGSNGEESEPDSDSNERSKRPRTMADGSRAEVEAPAMAPAVEGEQVAGAPAAVAAGEEVAREGEDSQDADEDNPEEAEVRQMEAREEEEGAMSENQI